MARKSLFEEAGKYFDKETGVLEAPLLIRVADQVRDNLYFVSIVVIYSMYTQGIQNKKVLFMSLHWL